MDEALKKLLGEKGRRELPSVLLAAAECSPLAKTGGLADVVGTLPKALRKLGIDARVIIPCHKVIKQKYGDRMEHMLYFFASVGWRSLYVGIEKLVLDDVVIYLVDNEEMFGDKIYRGGDAEIEQYAFFNRAVMDVIPNLDFRPDIVHCNDWHTAMLPMLAKTQYPGCMQEKLRFVLTIHNLAFQGRTSFAYMKYLLRTEDRFNTPEYVELYGSAAFMKAGFVFADKINTVSPSYASEIRTPYFGEGLDGILNARAHDLSGIINGIDRNVFNPENDPLIPAGFSASDLSGKAVCKAELQKKMGLRVNPDIPLFAMVTRMTEQKGFDLVATIIDDIVDRFDIQFMILGSGDYRFENLVRGAEDRHRGMIASYIGYNEELAHLVYAGSDFYLMPSRFEPCGLSQMIAMRYGSIPIVRETGGLKDTVQPYNIFDDTGTGFSFKNYNAWEMRDIIGYAIECTRKKEVKNGIIRRAMEIDYGFDNSALEYARLYVSSLHPGEEGGSPFESGPAVVSYDSRETENRFPYGAVRCGQSLRLSFEVTSGCVSFADLVLKNDENISEYPMEYRGGRFSVEITAPDVPAAYEFCFRLYCREGVRYVLPDASGFSGVVSPVPGDCFCLTVFLRNFETPAPFRRSVMYQVFPDRFAVSNDEKVKAGIAYHAALGQFPELHESVEEEPRHLPREFEEEYFPDDFYGGTLRGIEERLGYISALGVNCIYINPVFEARSNHRYDTSDYFRIDPVLGDEDDFTHLCAEAEKLGIRIILDGVFSHTGADSIYFNYYGNYGSGGAAQDKESPYYPWYSFTEYPAEYKSWWGIKNLPEVDELNPHWQDMIISGENSVVKSWLRKGAYGWRIDVADELPDEALSVIRNAAKSVRPDTPVIGEVWENAVTKVSYGEKRNYALGYSLDSVMNYPLRDALISFFHGMTDAYGLRDFLESQKMDYPAPLYYSLMNLLGSHDTARILNVLALPVNFRKLERDEQLKLRFTEENMATALKRERLAAVIQFSLPGVPSIYYGDEQGMEGIGDPFCRRPFREGDGALHDFYARLASLRNANPALSVGEAYFAAASADELVIKRRISGGRDVFGLPAKDGEFTVSVNRATMRAEINGEPF